MARASSVLLLDLLYAKLLAPPRQKLIEFRLRRLDNLIL